MDFFKLGKIGATAHWKKNHFPIIDYINLNHQNLLLEKARLIGFIMGDGSITKLGHPPSIQHHDISFYPDDYLLVNIFIKDFERLYLKKPKFKDLGNYYSIKVSSKPAADDLRSYGDFSSLNWKLPKKLNSVQEKIEWAKAIFDCEAHVSKKDVRIQSVSKGAVHSINKFFKELKIKSHIYSYDRKNPKWNINYHLVIYGKENIKKYQYLIGFNHSKKQEKLKLLAGVPER